MLLHAVVFIVVVLLLLWLVSRSNGYTLAKDYSLRGVDSYGSGAYGAPRGNRTHRGLDIVPLNGHSVRSPIDGVVIRHGVPYSTNNGSLQLVEIQGKGKDDDLNVKLMYLTPIVPVGHTVKRGSLVGFMESLQFRYKGITDHIHLEVRQNGIIVNPDMLNV